MTTKKKKNSKSKKPISFDEFKAWLSGVEDLQEEGWFPSKEQWDIIREKIESIKITNMVQELPTQPPKMYSPPPRPMLPSGTTLVPDGANEQNNVQMNRYVTNLPSVFNGGSTNTDSSIDSPFI